MKNEAVPLLYSLLVLTESFLLISPAALLMEGPFSYSRSPAIAGENQLETRKWDFKVSGYLALAGRGDYVNS